MTNLNGIPDLMAIKKGRIVFIEVKQPGKPLAHLQQHRILQLQREGIEAFRADCLRDVEHLLT